VEIVRTVLPGIGLRYEFGTRSGHRVGVLSYRDGRRELVIYGRGDDPDSARETLPLTDDEGDLLAELLGAPRFVERLADLRQVSELLRSEQLPVPAGSVYDGRVLGDTRARTRSGASIVAVVRGEDVHASPRPDFRLAGGDVLLVVGTDEGVEAVRRILAEG
jgi:TrkA domain protein